MSSRLIPRVTSPSFFFHQVTAFLRLLGITLPLLTSGLEIVFQLEGIVIDLPITSRDNNDFRNDSIRNDNIRRQNALVCHTLASIHPSLVSEVTLRAIKFGIRVCGGMTESPGMIALMIDQSCLQDLEKKNKSSAELISSDRLTVAFKLVCIEMLKFHSFLTNCV